MAKKNTEKVKARVIKELQRLLIKQVTANLKELISGEYISEFLKDEFKDAEENVRYFFEYDGWNVDSFLNGFGISGNYGDGTRGYVSLWHDPYGKIDTPFFDFVKRSSKCFMEEREDLPFVNRFIKETKGFLLYLENIKKEIGAKP